MKKAKAMWAWLAKHGFGHWGKCSPEGVIHEIVHGTVFRVLTETQVAELWDLAEAAQKEETEAA